MTQPRERRDTLVPMLGLLGLLGGVAGLLVLHVVPPTNAISPVRRTISEYALGQGKWLFDLALLLVAVGSALGFAELARRRAARPLALVLGAVWTVSLLVIVVFTKTDWTVGPSVGGLVHRYASVAAFLSLPLAVLLMAGRVFPRDSLWRWTARGLGALSLLWFGTIVVGAVNMLNGGPPWWRFVPLGLVERMVAGSAVAALVVLLLGLVRSRPQVTEVADRGPARLR
ncbi:DUF998 domain-containing protein [Actinokineospora sp. NBRC 105648]|uniref:DUF998 domain-containing protein n=1 Tax=Actinokineospora sp. NBRC 105648 TaxID=3032206 RepID=UPI0024A32114|nr:DUF998 domain-containing protein [Actinokineospora sp. NBRC 105648]GLZ38827.1 hypothetical protein Acsp05_24510 [Actinokineospora sp. NBRC 105648]